jgi:hypothetical protein
MAKQQSPHTQTQQDTHFAQTDVSPNELEQNTGHASEYENHAEACACAQYGGPAGCI